MGGVGCTLYELKAMSWDFFLGECVCVDVFGWWMRVYRYFFRMSGVYFRWVGISRNLLWLGGILLKKD